MYQVLVIENYLQIAKKYGDVSSTLIVISSADIKRISQNETFLKLTLTKKRISFGVKKNTKRTEIASPVSSPYQPVDGAPTFERPMNILNIFSHDSQMYIL